MTTYTSSLGLALPTSGDLSGTWGDVLNNYVTQYVDAAVGGVLTISTDGNVTLTVANGTALNSTSAQYSTLNLSGVRTAVRTVTLPSSSRQYFVYNNTTGGYSATVGGVTVFNGERCVIAYDTVATLYVKVASSLYGTTQAAGTNNTTFATTAFTKTAIDNALAASVYPVGSIYMNASSAVNPGTLLGFGTWTAFGAGRVLVGFNASNVLFDTAEETGGSYDSVVVTHTHTASTGNQSVDHTHLGGANVQYGSTSSSGTGLTAPTGTGTDGTNWNTSGTSVGHTHAVTVDSAGTSGTNANIQPYITVYMWKRTA